MSDGDIIDSQVEILRAGMHKHYKEQMQEQGVRGAWPELLEDAGGDHVEAARTMSRSLGGVYVGPVIDPQTGDPGGESAVLRHERSKAIFGPAGKGKSTISITDGMVQTAAAGYHTVLISPQPKTMTDAQKPVRAVSESGSIEIFDVGGRIVEEGAPRPTTWDPTSRCLDAGAARAFGHKLAGPDSPAGIDLGKGNGSGFWLMIPEIIAAQTAHLVQIERVFKRMNALNVGLSAEAAEAISLSGENRTGIQGVFDFMKLPKVAEPSHKGTVFEGLSGSLQTGLTPVQRERLAHDPKKLRSLQRAIRNAAYNAASIPLSLQKLVYNKVLLKLQLEDLKEELGDQQFEALVMKATPGYGAEEHPLKRRDTFLDKELMDDDFAEVLKMVEEVGKGQKDPLLQLGRQVRQALPPLEQRMLSPKPNDRETSPYKIVRGPAGFTVVAYDSGGNTGLAAGWFCDELIKEGLRLSKELQAEKVYGPTEEFAGVSVWVDEGGALRYIDLDLAFKEGRQHKVAVNVTSTSYEALVDDIGPSKAAAIVNSAPYLIQYALSAAAAAEVSGGFGEKEELKPTYNFSSDTGGHHVSFTPHDVPLVPLKRLRELEDGEMVITSTSKDRRERHTDIVKGWAFFEQGNPIGDLVAMVNEMEGFELNWAELAPRAKARYEAKLAARQRALEPPPGPSRPGEVKMLPDDVQDQLDALDDFPAQAPPAPGEVAAVDQVRATPPVPGEVAAVDQVRVTPPAPGAFPPVSAAFPPVEDPARIDNVKAAMDEFEGKGIPLTVDAVLPELVNYFTETAAAVQADRDANGKLPGDDNPNPHLVEVFKVIPDLEGLRETDPPAFYAAAQDIVDVMAAMSTPTSSGGIDSDEVVVAIHAAIADRLLPQPPAEKTVEQPAQQPATDAPAQQPAEQKTDAPVRQPAEPVSDAPAQQPANDAPAQPAEQPVKEAPAEQPAQPAEQPVKDAPAGPANDAPAQPAEQPVKEAPAEQPAKPAEQPANDAPAQPAEQPVKDAPAEQPAEGEPRVRVIKDTLEPGWLQDVTASDTPATPGPAESVQRDEPASMPDRDEPASVPEWDEPTFGPDDPSFGSSWDDWA